MDREISSTTEEPSRIVYMIGEVELTLSNQPKYPNSKVELRIHGNYLGSDDYSDLVEVFSEDLRQLKNSSGLNISVEEIINERNEVVQSLGLTPDIPENLDAYTEDLILKYERLFNSTMPGMEQLAEQDLTGVGLLDTIFSAILHQRL